MTARRLDLIEQLEGSIPPELREGKWWLLWKLERGAKKPYYADGAKRSGRLDSDQDCARLVSFAEAAEAYRSSKGYAGLGVALGTYDDKTLSGIDLDDCVQDGSPTRRAQQIIDAAESYAEISPSGEGVKIFGIGDIGTRGAKDGDGLEIYSHGRFFTVTGQALNGAHLADLTRAADFARRLFSDAGKVHVDFAAAHQIPDGKRNSTLASIAGRLRRDGLSADEIAAALQRVNVNRCKPVLSADEVDTIARSIGRYETDIAERPLIVLRTAFDLVANPTPARWLLKPYLEQDVLAVMAGEYGTYKSFLSLDWALHIAAGRAWHGDPRGAIEAQAVVFISAEGRGLAKRVRAWVQHRFPDEAPDGVLKRLKFYAIEMALDLSKADRLDALLVAIDALGITPVLIVVDTLTKNSSGVEENNSAMQEFLNSVNATLRMRYRCSLLMIHHVGHVEKNRARGPSSLVANTDASFLVERIDTNVVLRTDRLKDSEVPDPITLHATVIDLGRDEEGQPVSSLVLDHDAGFDPRVIPTGANQRKVWDALAARGSTTYSKEELSALARGVIARERISETISGLRKSRWLIERAGRYEFDP